MGENVAVRELVDTFVDAFNHRDRARLLAIVHDEFEFRLVHTGFTGKAALAGLLRQQADGAGYHIVPGRRFERHGQHVAEIRKELRWVENNELALVEDVAGMFVVEAGRLVRYQEYDDLPAALADAAMTEADEVVDPPRP